ncbi:cell division protein [Sporolactobacillus shoreicorticis]|uniref:Cell division protein n=1 Tax=Sporolactobacillus shoreicorticis TaxID=1923877 RepID=A0ABW5RZR9_9BACL|nr:cell division protein [Sporolactobacillus shoreicorticis]MCO7125032.1 cell division protein [Sporolactobacillus shoreicorticis]
MADIIGFIFSGIATFFVNPLLYLLLIALFLYSAQRVRRERRSFRVKAYGMFNTVFASVAPSLLVGLAATIVLLVAGISLTPGVMALLSAAYVITLFTCRQSFLSPAVAGGLTVLAAYFTPTLQTPYSLINGWIADIRTIDYVSFGIFLVVGMLAETALVYFWGAQQTSPRLISSKRGGLIGAHEACQLWIAPLFFLVPIPGGIPSVGNWPFVSGGASFSFAIFPLGVGIAQLITHAMPQPAVRQTAHWLMALSGITAIFIAAGYLLHLPLLIALGGAAALVGRLLLIWYHRHLRKTRPFYYLMPNRGLRVVGTIPHSLGARMGIIPGEEILRVNDSEVGSVGDFYEALQRHAAYCKLEVIDRFGEQRFEKGPIHEDDNYKIGLLFLEGDQWNLKQKTNS